VRSVKSSLAESEIANVKVFSLVSLTFFGGVNEIGGNKVLLKDGDAKIFLDFGQSFTMGSDFFTGWLSPRAINGLGDYFEFGLLPKLPGLYNKEHLKFTDLKYTEPEFSAVFLSHAHFDHVNHIPFLGPQIPIHLGVGTKLFLESMEKTSSFCNYGTHTYHEFRTGDKIKVDDVEVEPIHVDHSIPAAYAFLIHTSAGEVVYTGDLRTHGPRGDMTNEFADRAREAKPVALVCEGTRMVEREKRKNHSEKQVEEASDQIVSSTSKIVFFTRYSRDMDRFRTFYNVAKRNNREIVVSPKTAYLLSKLVSDKHLSLPDPTKDSSIWVYFKRKRSGEFQERDYYVWEREFLEKRVTHEFVRKNQSKLLMDLDFYQFAELVDIKPNPRSHFIHSMSEPRSEEDIEDRIMHNWLNHFTIEFHQLHASGHLSRRQLETLVARISPDTVFPIHTEAPGLFKHTHPNTQIPKLGEEYPL
jgi:ribonuclease J